MAILTGVEELALIHNGLNRPVYEDASTAFTECLTFLKFWFDRSHFEKDEDFRQLDLDGRKNALADVLDENQLYLNYADMNDTRHNVTADEKALTDAFYGTN